MWSPVQAGTATGSFNLLEERIPGSSSPARDPNRRRRRMGREKSGMNHAEDNWVAGKTYEGDLRIHSTQPTSFTIKAQSRDGSKTYASVKLSTTKPKEWEKICYSLIPSESDQLAPSQSCSISKERWIWVMFSFNLVIGADTRGCPSAGTWWRALLDEGITVIRYGGSMVNPGDYQWKKILGPRDERVISMDFGTGSNTNGWGIIDLLDLGEATGILCIPAFNMNETPQDMGDCVEYAMVQSPLRGSPARRRRASETVPPCVHRIG